MYFLLGRLKGKQTSSEVKERKERMQEWTRYEATFTA